MSSVAQEEHLAMKIVAMAATERQLGSIAESCIKIWPGIVQKDQSQIARPQSVAGWRCVWVLK
jgi:hypothetical protein